MNALKQYLVSRRTSTYTHLRMKLLIVFCVALATTNARIWRRSVQSEYKMCVPENLMGSCDEMVKQETKSAAKIVCIPARDRLECIEKIKKRQADFGTVDPEDMYVAAKVPDNDFTIFEEIRTREEPEAEFRYEGVALVHKDLDIKSPKDIKGLRSCHTGVGRNVGYKIPITKLKNMGIIGNLADPSMSPRENELSTFSNLFSKACIVGDWSPDPETDAKLKKRYSNLCQLCEHPEKCNYPDNFSGYEGAIRCLVHNGGQIAWTKVIYVRKFFGLPVGTTPARETSENPEDYAYFCPDGTKVPVTSDVPCRWAARPWQGYMANAAVIKNIDDLRRKIENLNSIGYKNHAGWLQKVLEISDKNIAKENKPISPKDYLDKANYTDVIERNYGPPFKTVRICTHSADELEKCRALRSGAFTRNVRPQFDCVQEDDCLKVIQDNGADVINLPPEKLRIAIDEYNLKPIVAEKYGEDGNYAVAVVKKQSTYSSLADLKGAKSCHSSHAIAGYYAPIGALKQSNLLQKPVDCTPGKALSEYFSGSCLPGADTKYNVPSDVQDKLCGLCKGEKKCYNHDTLKCLQDGGDVAFMESRAFAHMTESDKENYELICRDGRRAPLKDYKTCSLLAKALPPFMVVTSNSKSTEDIEEIQGALLSASELYSDRPDWFKMFGSFNGKHDLLFSDLATQLESAKKDFTTTEISKMLSAADNFCK